MTKDGGTPGFPQMFQFNMSPTGMNELGHTVFFDEQQSDAVRVSFQIYFYRGYRSVQSNGNKTTECNNSIN